MKLKNIFNHRNRTLLRELVATDFKLRYQGSALGYLWSLMRPLLLFGILLTVFGFVLKIGSTLPHYPTYLLLGIVLWSFFVEATNNGLGSIVGRSDLIRKLNFPRYIIVLSGTVSAFINLGISLVVMFVFLFFSGVHLRPISILFIPLVIELYVLALALAFGLSTLYVKYRDVGYIWEVLMQALFYGVPIIYPLSLVSNKSALLAKIMLLNPIAQIVQDSRYVLITSQTETLSKLSHNQFAILIPIIIVVVLVVAAGMYFRKNSPHFAENV